MERVIAILDIGKTNKKLLLYNEAYQVVLEQTAQLPETTDEDGDPCEDLDALTNWIRHSMQQVLQSSCWQVVAVNAAAYGASFVLIGADGRPVAPLYNYLKPYPTYLKQQFYAKYGGAEQMALQTASPVLGSLNSGMQLYRLKQQQPQVFAQIKYALHLPQYVCWLLGGRACSDITSVGCHTQLWHFGMQAYHSWVAAEGIAPVLAPMVDSTKATTVCFAGKALVAGSGLHDSSAALIPYLLSVPEPFALISTGTWCITLNPFNHSPLTHFELTQDCLCYLTYTGQAVKAARAFIGNEHEQQVMRLTTHFGQQAEAWQQIAYQAERVEAMAALPPPTFTKGADGLLQSGFANRPLDDFTSLEAAYTRLMMDLVALQVHSARLVLHGSNVQQVLVDGGFGRNALYMQLLANALAEYRVSAAEVPQATALGAALAIHSSWHSGALPAHLVQLKHFAAIPLG
jgi:sugar (pentulose or hexulose) kinase